MPLLGLGLALALAGCSKADAPPAPGGTVGQGPVSAAAPGAAPDGGALFATHCGRCHGPGGKGTEQGPPLVHRIYEPSHHPDAAFYRAVDQGVRAHHWRYGDMPRVGRLTTADVTAIIGYVRERQREAGIF